MNRKDIFRNKITSVVLSNYHRGLDNGTYRDPLDMLNEIASDKEEKSADRIQALRVLTNHVMNKAPSDKFIEVQEVKPLYEMTPEEKEAQREEIKELMDEVFGKDIKEEEV